MVEVCEPGPRAKAGQMDKKVQRCSWRGVGKGGPSTDKKVEVLSSRVKAVCGKKR